MVGMLINTLPLRVRVPGEASLLPWLRDLQGSAGELLQHEHDEPTIERAARIGDPRQLIGEEHEAGREWTMPCLPELAVDGQRILAG